MLNLMVERHNKGQCGNAEIAPSSKKKQEAKPSLKIKTANGIFWISLGYLLAYLETAA